MATKTTAGHPLTSTPSSISPGASKTFQFSKGALESFLLTQVVIHSDIGDDVEVEHIKVDGAEVVPEHYRGSFFSEHAYDWMGKFEEREGEAFEVRVKNVSAAPLSFAVMLLGTAVQAA